MENYPFHGDINLSDLDSGYRSITGQLILSEGHEVNRNLTSRPDYLLRMELQQLNNSNLQHFSKNNFTVNDLINALNPVRNAIQNECKDMAEYLKEEYPEIEDVDEDWNTGADARKHYQYDFRTWHINSDVIFMLESDDLHKTVLDIQAINAKYCYAEFYGIVTLWAVDESVKYLNDNQIHKASIWLLRASRNDEMRRANIDLESNNSIMSDFASKGGKARAEGDDRHIKLNLILNEYKKRELNGYNFNLAGRLTKFYDEMTVKHDVAFGSVKNRIEKFRRQQKQSS